MLSDQHGREKRKLRISLTDRCNYRCTYCMPEAPTWLPKDALLSVNEFEALATTFVESGITHIRLTGGEPLLYPKLNELVSRLNSLRAIGLQKLSMTTNASLLAPVARGLKEAGLDDLNISLDSLNPSHIDALSRGSAKLDDILNGIDAAVSAGLPVKINSVLVRGENDHEVLDLVRWATARNLPLRFIEFMPLEGGNFWQQDKVVSEASILAELRTRYSVSSVQQTSDPAHYFDLYESKTSHAKVGQIGIISTITNPFCRRCDRLRITAAGELYTCLFAQQGTPLRQHIGQAQLLPLITQAVHNKAAGYADQGAVERPITMHTLGG